MIDPPLDPMLPPRPIGEETNDEVEPRPKEETLLSPPAARPREGDTEAISESAPRPVDITVEPLLPPRPEWEQPQAPVVERPRVDISLEPLVPRPVAPEVPREVHAPTYTPIRVDREYAPPPRADVDTSLDALNADSEEAPEDNAPGTGGLAAFALFLCLAALHVLANLWWFQADHHAISADEAGHMQLAREFHEVLFVQDFPDPLRRLIAASHILPGTPAHPPLFHLMGAVMIQIFGYGPDTIAATSTVLFVVLLIGCFCLARSFLNPWQSLFAVFVVSMTPMVFASSRFYMTDYGAAAFVVWSLFALVKSQGLRRSGWVFVFALLSGLGILTRTVTFAYFLAPALLAGLCGIVAALNREEDEPGFGPLVANMLMALVVTIGVFAPWYYANLEPFYDYWENKEIAGTRGPLTNFLPPPPATIEPAAAPALMADQSSYARFFRTVSEKVSNPPVAWSRYPVYLVNEGVFATLAGLALLGMVFAPLRTQFRALPLAFLYLWILGSWAFFSVIIRTATARYGLPVAPAIAFFAALFILALPGRWLRFTAGAMLSVVLLVQYAMLTIQPMGPNSRVGVPVVYPAEVAQHFTDSDLVVLKDHLTLGSAYARLGAPETGSFQERLMKAMVEHEKSLPTPTGPFANYQAVQVPGLEFHERHYWPGNNPYRLSSVAPGGVPDRQLTLIHRGDAPESLLPRLEETEYIVYEVPADQPEVATGYQAFFENRGFTQIDAFDVPAFGPVAATRYGLLARKLEAAPLPVVPEAVPANDRV